jgi:hypothetical protein
MMEVIDCVVAFCKHQAFSKPKSMEIIYIYICHHITDDSHNGIQGSSYQNSSLSIMQL